MKAMLAGWESKTPYERIDHKVADNGTGLKEDIVTPDKSNAEYLAGLSFALSGRATLTTPRSGSATSFSAAARSPRGSATEFARRTGFLTARPRRSPLHPATRWPQLTVTVSTNPANIDKVTAAVMEELQRFLKDGPTEKEVADAKQAFVESQKVGRTGDAAIAGQIVFEPEHRAGRSPSPPTRKRRSSPSPRPGSPTRSASTSIPNKLVILRAGISRNKGDSESPALRTGHASQGDPSRRDAPRGFGGRPPGRLLTNNNTLRQ